MQTRLSIFSNLIFKYFILFSIAFLWINFYVDDLLLTTVASLLISLVIGKIISLINKKKKEHLLITIKEQEKIKHISHQFILTHLSETVRFYSIILGAKREVTISKDNSYIEWQDTVFIPSYNNFIISSDTIAYYYKKFKDKKNIIIAGISFSDDSINLSEKLQNQIILLDERETFCLFKKYDFYPHFKVELSEKQKFTLTRLKDIFFIKSNAKKFFYSGIIILLSSFFIRYNIYYLIFATLLFIFAGISYFKPHTKTESIVEEL